MLAFFEEEIQGHFCRGTWKPSDSHFGLFGSAGGRSRSVGSKGVDGTRTLSNGECVGMGGRVFWLFHFNCTAELECPRNSPQNRSKDLGEGQQNPRMKLGPILNSLKTKRSRVARSGRC